MSFSSFRHCTQFTNSYCKFDRYYIAPAQSPETTEETVAGMFWWHTSLVSRTDINTLASTPEPPFHYGGSFLLNAVQAIQEQSFVAGGPRDELRQYLNNGAEPMRDIVGWWGVSLTDVLACCTHI